jgi:hypothetical protein
MSKRVQRLHGASRILMMSVFVCCAAIPTRAQETISGQVGNPGIAGAMVYLCDAATGIPISAETRQVSNGSNRISFLTVTTTQSGSFVFTNIPAGLYRMVAQTTIDATGEKLSVTKGISLEPTARLTLHGVAENVTVPSPAASHVVILPLGKHTLTLDQDMPNDDAFALLSLKPLTGDPIVGFLGWNRDFLSHIIGVGRMAHNKPLLIEGLPETNVQAAIFASDSSPGFGGALFTNLPAEPQKIPIIVGWSDARHIPPPHIIHILEVLDKANTDAEFLLKFKRPKSTKMSEFLKELKESLGPLDREVVLPNGEKATVVDLYACMNYKRLLEQDEKRRKAQKP